MSTIHASFALQTNGRVDSTRVGNQRILAERVNDILDNVDIACRSDERHHVTNEVKGNQVRHQEVWFEKGLDLSIAMYPDEATDRTFTTTYTMTQEDGRLEVEKTETKVYGKPQIDGWNVA